jgi:hypothetical protein
MNHSANPGEAVTFKIGEMVIGRTTGADVLYPTHITDSKPAAVKVAQVLQTLDKDSNPDNGIDIERQFKLEFTRNEDIQEVSSLQDCCWLAVGNMRWIKNICTCSTTNNHFSNFKSNGFTCFVFKSAFFISGGILGFG